MQSPATQDDARTVVPRSRPRWVVVSVCAGVMVLFTVLFTVLALSGSDGELGVIDALVLGVVEGVTEYLPVSSTGHLAVAQRLLGIDTSSGTAQDAADSYAIAIQLGAILAVAGLYRRRLSTMVAGLAGRDPDGRQLLTSLVVAFVPAAVVGLLLGDVIKENLFGIWPIVGAWFVGGLAILLLSPRTGGGVRALEAVTLRDAALIGCAQVLALWPGTSRSLVTILAALAVGLTLAAAVEFSFLLGLATLGAATTYEMATSGTIIIEQYGLLTPLIGLAASFISAIAAVRWLVAFLSRRPLTIFGWYRIAIAILVGGLALTPVLSGA